MRKGTDLIGKPIIAYDSGRKVGTVRDLIFSQNQSALVAFLTEEPKWFGSGKIVLVADIKAIGIDGILIDNAELIQSADKVPAVQHVIEQQNVLRGTEIMTISGRNLGKMVDLYFNAKTGDVEGYEVSGGVFSDAYTGRSFVPVNRTFHIGQDFAFVPDSVTEMMEEQIGGFKGAMIATNIKAHELGEVASVKAHELSAVASEKLTEAQEKATEKAGEFSHSASNAIDRAVVKTRSAVASYTVEEALGRRVRTTIYSQDGEIIAAMGQIVTESIIEQARYNHREKALIEATGLSLKDATKYQTSLAADHMGSQAQEWGGELQYQASNAFAWARKTTDRLFDRGSNAIEEKRIKGALGRPVNRVILDSGDGVLLNVGELVTHQAIVEARQADVLDILLGSIYDEAPYMTKNDMKAPSNGSAALSRAN
ncbi:MAG: PRC-barrel domain-containing protein [Cyanobacteria bacterium]|nr:PRC-barrel domain-containing protein [Cyanobacteriota bacterium]